MTFPYIGVIIVSSREGKTSQERKDLLMKNYVFTLVTLADPDDIIISRTFTGDLSTCMSKYKAVLRSDLRPIILATDIADDKGCVIFRTTNRGEDAMAWLRGIDWHYDDVRSRFVRFFE